MKYTNISKSFDKEINDKPFSGDFQIDVKLNNNENIKEKKDDFSYKSSDADKEDKNKNQFDISSSYKNNNESRNNRTNQEINKEKKDNRKHSLKLKSLKALGKGQISLKYKVFVITLWIIFFISFLVGFITHFNLKLPITASGIIWSFNFIIFIIALIYTYLYYKIIRSPLPEDKLKLLQNFPM